MSWTSMGREMSLSRGSSESIDAFPLDELSIPRETCRRGSTPNRTSFEVRP
jgi:hypothetical protein